MVVRPDAISTKDQESAGEHETEDHPNSLKTDTINTRRLGALQGCSRLAPGIQ